MDDLLASSLPTGVVWALVCSIGDSCADVRVAAQSSLCSLGAKQPTPVLRALLHTCMQQPSPAVSNFAFLESHLVYGFS